MKPEKSHQEVPEHPPSYKEATNVNDATDFKEENNRSDPGLNHEDSGRNDNHYEDVGSSNDDCPDYHRYIYIPHPRTKQGYPGGNNLTYSGSE